jgi:hypothetical protein
VSDSIKDDNIIGGQDFLFENLDKIEVIGNELEQIPTFIDLSVQYDDNPDSMEVVFANPEKAGKLRDLGENLPTLKSELLANVDQLDVVFDLAAEFTNDTEEMSVVFANSGKAVQLRDLSKDLQGKGDDLLANVDQLDVIGELVDISQEIISLTLQIFGQITQLHCLS